MEVWQDNTVSQLNHEIVLIFFLRFRDFQSERGLLQEGQIMPSGKGLLPPALNTPVDCQIDPNSDHVPCFLAGDHRVNEQLGE